MRKCFAELSLFVTRKSQSEFIVSLNKYLEARNYRPSVGMKFKMKFEGREVLEKRYCLLSIELVGLRTSNWLLTV